MARTDAGGAEKSEIDKLPKKNVHIENKLDSIIYEMYKKSKKICEKKKKYLANSKGIEYNVLIKLTGCTKET